MSDSKTWNGMDMRSQPRYHLSYPIDFSPDRSPAGAFQAMTLDISACGARIKTSFPLSAGETIDMAVCFDRSDNQMVRFSQARVVWVSRNENVYIAGIAFRNRQNN